jgi:predicted metal-dependent hydrolase
MSADSLQDPYDLNTLIHEFIHLNNPKFAHGKKFTQLQRKLVKEAKRALSAVRSKSS